MECLASGMFPDVSVYISGYVLGFRRALEYVSP